MSDKTAVPPPQATTIRDCVASGAERLTPVTDCARLEAEVLLSGLMNRERAYLRAWPDQQLDAESVENFDRLIASRADGMPLAYLLGEREFWSRTFQVGPAVLIPRPETELLIELALAFVETCERPRILDLGTGSGAIAITLALECPDATVVGIDISPAALETARRNAETLGATHAEFRLGSWFAPLKATELFDLIVSNPPYLADDDPHLQQGDLRFEPTQALRAGPSGLEALDAIAAGALAHLLPNGKLLMEHGCEQAEAARQLLRRHGYRELSCHTDLQKHPRVSGGTPPSQPNDL